MNNFIQHYLNGQWVSEDKLLVSAQDLSVVRGYGVFDWMRTYQGKPFKLVEHIERLFYSADLVKLQIPVTKEELLQIINKGLQMNPPREYGARIIVTGGVSKNSVAPIKQASLIVIFERFDGYDPEIYEKGLKVISFPHTRFLPNAKSINYLSAIVASQLAQEKEAVEAIYLDKDNNILEGTRTNLFIVEDGVIKTAAEDVLEGVTRQLVLDICQQNKLPLDETKIKYEQVNSCSEMFITSSGKEILPIVQFDDIVIGDGQPGTVTKQLMDLYKQKVQLFIDN